MFRSVCSTAFAVVLASAVIAGQQHQHGPAAPEKAKPHERPDTWKVRYDKPDADDATLYFETMKPGWHITTGPAAIFYEPARTARAPFKASTTIFLFDPKGRNEAFGIFFGGRNLDAAEQAYSYFVIRNSGDFLVRRRSGDKTQDVVRWTPSDAIVKWDGKSGPDASVKNVLAVEAAADAVSFFINDQKVKTVPASEVDVDGNVGLRVNHRLNVHVSSLDVK
jgi:hypothetical protein